MKTLFIVTLFLANTCFAQKVSLANYDNITDIDNYWGEIDSLLLKHKITAVETYILSDSFRLRQIEYYKDGRKTKVEEGYLKEGVIERQILYTYLPNRLEAKIIHYSSRNNRNKISTSRYHYLVKEDEPGKISFPYAPDSSGNVIMTIAHNWLPNGDIFFESFDKKGVLIDSFTLHRSPVIENEVEKLVKFPMKTGVGTDDERHYNQAGNLKYLRDCSGDPCHEYKYAYDPEGFLVKVERFVGGTLRTTTIYKYR
jgi:hypothetical protein